MKATTKTAQNGTKRASKVDVDRAHRILIGDSVALDAVTRRRLLVIAASAGLEDKPIEAAVGHAVEMAFSACWGDGEDVPGA